MSSLYRGYIYKLPYTRSIYYISLLIQGEHISYLIQVDNILPYSSEVIYI